MDNHNSESPAAQRPWQPDCLGGDFVQTVVEQPRDYAGQVITTVVKTKPASARPAVALLYVHGFSDYFFQKEMARMFADNGYAFYAVDLRKYGRSLLPGQKMFQVRDLREYFEDIDAAIDIIKSDGFDSVVILGHSTGGLTSSLYMAEKPQPVVKALMLNSPFLDWNLPWLQRTLLVPLVSAVGRFFPSIKVRQTPDAGYAETLSARHSGEWCYNEAWKPDILPDPDAGWVRAVNKAQKALRRSKICVPVLLMFSADSVRKGDDREKYFRADAILDVRAISRYGRRLGKHVTEVAFDGGLHDLALSRPDVRNAFYRTMLQWLRKQGL